MRHFRVPASSGVATELPEPYTESVHFTPRERDILAEVCQGSPNKQIAARLEITPLTAKRYVSSLIRSLKLDNRSVLLIWVLQHPSAVTSGSAAFSLHKQGCACAGAYCVSMREMWEMRRKLREAA